MIDDPESIMRCTNKVYLAELAKRHDLATPRTMVVQREHRRHHPRARLAVRAEAARQRVLEGVVSVDTREELVGGPAAAPSSSDLVVAQEFVPTEFDWRIGVLDGKPLYACRYFMARGHWQIITTARSATKEGETRDARRGHAPREVLELALKAANADRRRPLRRRHQESGRPQVVMEVNDNPNIDAASRTPARGRALRAHHGVFMRASMPASNQTPATRRAARPRQRVEPPRRPLRLFEGFGIELEYMIVDAATLDVRPRPTSCSRPRPARRRTSSRTAPSPGRTSSRCTSSSSRRNGPRPTSRAWARRSARTSRRERAARPRRPAPDADRDAPVDGPRTTSCSGRTTTRGSTPPSTASSTAAATAGRTCRACTSTCRSTTTTSSAGCTRRSASCCRSCPRSPRARRSSTARRTAPRQAARRLPQQLRAHPVGHGRGRARGGRLDGEYDERLLGRSTATSRRTIPRACCGTSGSTRAARSRASTAWRSRSACSTCRRRRGWTSRSRL